MIETTVTTTSSATSRPVHTRSVADVCALDPSRPSVNSRAAAAWIDWPPINRIRNAEMSAASDP